MAYKKRIAGITIEIDGDTSKLVKSLDQASKKVEGVGKKIEGIGKTLTTHLTVPIVTAAGVAVSKFAEVDKTMTLTNQTMQNSAEEAELLNKAMQDAASNSTFGMNDAAQASLNFARAGLDATEAANALAPAMNLAAGEGGDLDIVSAGLVATINGFGDTFDNAEHYADIFANACNNSALDVNSLSDAMSTAAPIFNAAGYTVQDASLYMGVMANAGIDASEAANSLKTGMARLISPAKEGSAWMERLGIEVTNADGSMKDSVTVQRELHDAFGTLSESEQIAAASAIFGKNQMSKWLALINTAPADVEALNASLEQEGTTADMANAMMGGFGGSIEKLKSSLDVLMTSLGQLAAQYLTPVIEKVQGAIDKFMALDDETKEHIIKIAGIVAAVGPVLLIIGKVVSGIGSIISIASGLIAAITAISAPVLGVIAVITAVIAIGVLLYKNWDTIKEKATELWQNLKEKFEIIKMVITMTWDAVKEKTSEAFNTIKDKIANSQIGQAAAKVWDAMKKTASDSFNAIKKAYDEHGGGLKGAVSATMEAIKQYYSAGYNFIDNLTGGKLSAIKDKVSSTFDSVKEKVRSAIDYIKGLFNFSWSLPDIRLPHFSVSGQFSLNPPQIPHFSVQWYKKAMDDAYMLNGATIFGQSGGKLLGGGEAGSEMIIGTNKLMSMIAQAKGGTTTYNNQFVINGVDRDPQQLAQEISYYLDMELQRTSGVFA
ncbi:MAG: phage tail tape measure protein [Aeriscardovia sp.]|nr:phage tail tape measure protein [Aeriscardovia sp.]